MRILAIDPGNIESAWVLFQKEKLSLREGVMFKIFSCGKELNDEVLDKLAYEMSYDALAMEEIVAYGKWSGREITDSAFWSGRFCQASTAPFTMINRSKVRWHLGGQKKVTDATIIERLIERFCPGLYSKYKAGDLTKMKMINASRDEYFENFHDDIWQAFALGVTWYDLNVH